MKIHQLDTILPGFAALDLGATSIHAATAQAPVAVFGTTTEAAVYGTRGGRRMGEPGELRRLAAWLHGHGARRVAFEATGVYWVPVHDQLQAAGFELTLFHGAHARNLPGKKSDFSDCQWHAVLHSHGLLRACFIPAEEVRALRAYARLREDHLEQAAMRVAQMQRALDLMNVRLHTVISQLHGVSGLRVVEAILAGERDPKALAAHCDAQILKTKRAEVEASLEGSWQEHHLFALAQALEAWRFHHGQIAACDARIEAQLRALNATRPAVAPLEPKKIKKVRHNAPQIEGLHGHLHTLCGGRDASVLPGLSPLGWMKLAAELGPDLSAWPNAKAFCSWLGLAPNRHQSGQRRRRVPRRHTRAGQIFREGALSIARSKHLALGGCYRRIRGRRGEAVAIVAIARKLAELYYLAMTRGLDYVEQGLARYEQHCRDQERHRLRKFASRLGFVLVPKTN